MTDDPEYAVYIGRFQPFHYAHEATLDYALSQAKKVIIVIGSANQPRSVKNPFTAEERIKMITRTLRHSDLFRVQFIEMPDFVDDNEGWVRTLTYRVTQITKDASVALVGFEKDASSFYLKLFPHWEFIPMDEMRIPEQFRDLSATIVRDFMFRLEIMNVHALTPVMVGSMVNVFMHQPEFQPLFDQWWEAVKGQKKSG